jgi:hypothetical protein
MLLKAGQEGPELPESRPTLAVTYLQIASQGHTIITAIKKLLNLDSN